MQRSLWILCANYYGVRLSLAKSKLNKVLNDLMPSLSPSPSQCLCKKSHFVLNFISIKAVQFLEGILCFIDD